jgi:ABC-type transporter Mla MlaB component
MAAPGPNSIVFALGGPFGRADLPSLCERLRALLQATTADVVLCDVGAEVEPDVVAIDALARLQLTARRHGCRVRLRQASPGLHDLLAFTGLADVVSVEPGGQAEEREDRFRVEEEGELGDPAL